jgi:hypothetical protein
MCPTNNPSPAALMLQTHLSVDRLSTYVQECQGDLDRAVAMYRWNSAVAAAFWESLGHVEVVVRNALCARLQARHVKFGRPGSWLDEPPLGPRALQDIATARERVRAKRKAVSDGQVVAELSFGFWRFMLAKRYTNLWPDLASAFPHAPDRDQQTVETPMVRLHEFRNRLAHHERVWSQPLPAMFADMMTVLGFVSPAVRDWVAATSRVQATLALRP